MNEVEIKEIIDKQRLYFNKGETLSVKFRVKMLKKLQESIKKYEKDILNALNKDLGKSDFEAYMCEVGLALSELNYMIKNVNKFAKEQRVRTPLAQFPSKSYKKPVPRGVVLIMSPWNYPFLLTMDPIIDALSAGNTVVVKPSAYSPATGDIVEKIISETFEKEYVAVVKGGRQENASLLEQKFDFIFFTGSENVGKEVLRKSAEHLTPAVLELGGKSPCIVDETANIKLSAKRIVFGKYLNCGQTCVAPDYILCHKSIKEKFVSAVKEEVIKQYGENALQNKDYGKIINEKHFERIMGLIDNEKVIVGGRSNKETLQIEPTIMDNVWNHNF